MKVGGAGKIQGKGVNEQSDVLFEHIPLIDEMDKSGS